MSCAASPDNKMPRTTYIHTDMKLILIDCSGLGIAYNDIMERIVCDIYYAEADAEIIHLQDEQGLIVCTLLRNQKEYEQRVNYDRRLQNNRNGFTVEYDSTGNGAWCCVRRAVKPKREGCLRRWAVTAVVAILGMIAGIAIGTATGSTTPQQDSGMDSVAAQEASGVETTAGYSSPANKENTESEPLQQELMAEADTTAVEPQEAGDSVAVDEPDDDSKGLIMEAEAEKALLARARKHKMKLQSMSCTLGDVLEVEKWWRSLDVLERRTARADYDFDKAINAYNNVFYARSAGELRHNIKRYYAFFSPSQRKTLFGMSSNEEIFDKIRHKIKKWSFEDMRRHVSMIGLMKEN